MDFLFNAAFSLAEAQYVLFLLAGLALLLFGAFMVVNEILFRRDAMELPGRVIAAQKEEKIRKREQTTFYYPLIEFTVPGQAEPTQFKGSTGSSSPSFVKIGKQVTVLYLEGKDPRLKSVWSFIIGAILAVVGGGLCIWYFVSFKFNLLSLLFVFAILTYGGVKLFNKLAQSPHAAEAKSLTGLLKKVWADGKSTGWKNKEKTTTAPDNTDNIITSNDGLQQENRKQIAKAPVWVGPAVFLAGVATLVGGIYFGIQRMEFMQTAQATSGVVIDLKESRSTSDGRTKYTYSPVVRFQLASSDFTFTDSVGSNPPAYNIDEQVDVLYDPRNPEEAIIDRGLFNWLLPFGLAAFGIILSLAGISIIRKKHLS